MAAVMSCENALLNGAELPWVPEVFLACGGNFRCWPGHYKDLTETGNRARKVSGTQGRAEYDMKHYADRGRSS